MDPGRYGYSVCEMSFLKRFAQDAPATWARMKTYNPSTFSIVGGAITSPDNLLPHGEAFIRAYLSGMTWLHSENVTWSGTVWLPDDFGHDSQLPTMLAALGVKAVSFSRVPGACNQGQNNAPKGVVSAHATLLNASSGGLNFVWAATDGARVPVYYMPNTYCCGDSLNDANTCEPNSPAEQASCTCSVKATSPFERLTAWHNVRAPVSASPYTFVATGCDFAMPVQELASTLALWNKEIYPKNGIYAVSSQFDVYYGLMQDYLSANRLSLQVRSYHGTDPTTSFRPTPYWTGFYSSRPALKALHYAAVRTLLGCEALALIARSANLSAPSQIEIDALWDDLAPSTHHDFITGTATDYVYQGEQLPLSTRIYNDATAMLDELLRILSEAIDEPGLLAFNSLGFPVEGVVEIAKAKWPYPSLQDSGDGASSLIYTSAPSLGYRLHAPSSNDYLPESVWAKCFIDAEGQVVLENRYLKAIVVPSLSYGVTILDKATGRTVVDGGNILQWREDGGNIYRYGFEEGCGFDKYDTSLTSASAEVVEEGPLRTLVRVQFAVTATSPTPLSPQRYVVEYRLDANEPYLRINVTGAAAGVSSVLSGIQFPLAIASLEHGTPYHWDTKLPAPFGKQPDFLVTMEAVHDFVIARDASGSALGAVYHSASPSWGALNNTLFGVLLRNSPGGTPHCNGYGADGSDEETHSVLFAIRIPTGLSSASTGQPLREARSFHTPLNVIATSRSSGGKPIAKEFSIATNTNPTSGVIVSAAKAGSFDAGALVLRLYNPTNKPVKAPLQLGENLVRPGALVKLVTALEAELSSPPRSSVISTRQELHVKYAVTTYLLS